jgi:hypothetical protein
MNRLSKVVVVVVGMISAFLTLSACGAVDIALGTPESVVVDGSVPVQLSKKSPTTVPMMVTRISELANGTSQVCGNFDGNPTNGDACLAVEIAKAGASRHMNCNEQQLTVTLRKATLQQTEGFPEHFVGDVAIVGAHCPIEGKILFGTQTDQGHWSWKALGGESSLDTVVHMDGTEKGIVVTNLDKTGNPELAVTGTTNNGAPVFFIADIAYGTIVASVSYGQACNVRAQQALEIRDGVIELASTCGGTESTYVTLIYESPQLTIIDRRSN